MTQLLQTYYQNLLVKLYFYSYFSFQNHKKTSQLGGATFNVYLFYTQKPSAFSIVELEDGEKLLFTSTLSFISFIENAPFIFLSTRI